MFGDLLGGADEIQQKLKIQLQDVLIHEDLDGISVEATGNGEIININIDEGLMTIENKEQVEDQLITVLNNLYQNIAEVAAEKSSKMLNEMLPGLSDMFK